MKVAKFGGSSLSSADQIKKTAQIIKNDSLIKVVVVSAPGKRFDDDIKVTDLLIALHKNYQQGLDISGVKGHILTRYAEIISDLRLTKDLLINYEEKLDFYLESIEESDYLLDALKSCGEDFNAQLIALYLKSLGLNATYVSPKDAGMMVTDEPGDAMILQESYTQIANLKKTDKVCVIPGFFGYTREEKIVTFSRGGSDVSGAIIARGISADSYENYTDQSYIYTAHPGIVDQPVPITQITYSEIRELSYAGFAIFHEEALQPLFNVEIPVVVKNTNAPSEPGTMIVSKRENVEKMPVVGVSGNEGYLSITIKEYLLNRQIGYLRQLLQIVESYGVSVEHVPTGIDYVTIIAKENQFQNTTVLNELIEELKQTFHPEWIKVEDNLGSIAVVGEGLHDITGPVHTATGALKEHQISPKMIIQGASEISIFFFVKEKDLIESIKVLYNQFFKYK